MFALLMISSLIHPGEPMNRSRASNCATLVWTFSFVFASVMTMEFGESRVFLVALIVGAYEFSNLDGFNLEADLERTLWFSFGVVKSRQSDGLLRLVIEMAKFEWCEVQMLQISWQVVVRVLEREELVQADIEDVQWWRR